MIKNFTITICCIITFFLSGLTANGDQNINNTANQKIINGEKASSGEWPWMAGLVDGPDNYLNLFCGGVLIASKWLLTAAHCVTDPPFEILLGVTNLSDKGTRIGVSRIYIHPEYFNSNGMAVPDLALIELESEAAFEPIELYQGPDSLEGVMGTIIGWGSLRPNGTQFPIDLMQADVPIVSHDECNDAYDGIITEYELCAGYSEGGVDSCSGDSGGPIMIFQNNTWKLAGITAWGEGCARPGYYGVYTRISRLLDWIDWNKNQYTQSDMADSNCASFDSISSILHIPCIDIGKKYWFDLELHDSHLTINNFGEF